MEKIEREPPFDLQECINEFEDVLNKPYIKPIDKCVLRQSHEAMKKELIKRGVKI